MNRCMSCFGSVDERITGLTVANLFARTEWGHCVFPLFFFVSLKVPWTQRTEGRVRTPGLPPPPSPT